MKFELRHVYYAVGILFYIAAIGSFLHLVIVWGASDVGQKIGGFANTLINLLIGYGMIRFSSSQAQTSLKDEDFDYIINNIKGGKNEETSRDGTESKSAKP